MKIIRIQTNVKFYSSNAYLVLGDWKRMEDTSTLIDTGSDPGIVDQIHAINTGLGKRKIDQVILTHNHSDHMAALTDVIRAFHPKVYAFSPFTTGVDATLRGGDQLMVGDRMCEILHIPGHSEDSICVFNPDEGELFPGDTQVVLSSANGCFTRRFREGLLALYQKHITAIYPGHGDPMQSGVKQTIAQSRRFCGEASADEQGAYVTAAINKSPYLKEEEVWLRT